ncbi:MAG: hypothetical protein IJL57_04285 [Bacteroidales bacterium]|nr:hypothetical protein [Bacteroidales bacterium]
MKKIVLLILVLYSNIVSSQTHTALYGDERFMECTFKGFYEHCFVKHDLEDGKWMFYYPGMEDLAVVANIKHSKWNGYYSSYRKDGSMSSLSTFKDDMEKGEYRSYWPNGQMHFKKYEPHGELLVLDSLGEVIRHESATTDSNYRKTFVRLGGLDILDSLNIQDSVVFFYEEDTYVELSCHSISGIHVFEVRTTGRLSETNTLSQKKIPLIGKNREELLDYCGTDFYIMTESYIDYVLNKDGMALLSINDIPSYLFRCCFDDDKVIKYYLVKKNEKLTYRILAQLLNGISRNTHNN